jgi:hypothetical protein
MITVINNFTIEKKTDIHSKYKIKTIIQFLIIKLSKSMNIKYLKNKEGKYKSIISFDFLPAICYE